MCLSRGCPRRPSTVGKHGSKTCPHSSSGQDWDMVYQAPTSHLPAGMGFVFGRLSCTIDLCICIYANIYIYICTYIYICICGTPPMCLPLCLASWCRLGLFLAASFFLAIHHNSLFLGTVQRLGGQGLQKRCTVPKNQAFLRKSKQT